MSNQKKKDTRTQPTFPPDSNRFLNNYQVKVRQYTTFTQDINRCVFKGINPLRLPFLEGEFCNISFTLGGSISLIRALVNKNISATTSNQFCAGVLGNSIQGKWKVGRSSNLQAYPGPISKFRITFTHILYSSMYQTPTDWQLPIGSEFNKQNSLLLIFLSLYRVLYSLQWLYEFAQYYILFFSGRTLCFITLLLFQILA